MSEPAPQPIPCPACGGERNAPVYDVRRFAQPFTMARCLACGLLHRNPRPPREVLDAYYDDAYYAGEADFSYTDEREHQEQVRVRAAGRFQRAARLLARVGIDTRRVVELGSAWGVVLDEARKLGWDVTGCEISADSAGWAREHFGLTIHECDLADAGIAPGSVDLVTASEVVEHLADPGPTFRAAWEVLRPGGLVIFSTANERSVARLARGAAWQYFMPGHVVVWSAATLARALREAGFGDVDVTAGDERGLANFLAFRRAAGGGSVPAWLVKRLRLGSWTVGAGMVVTARKPLDAGRG